MLFENSFVIDFLSTSLYLYPPLVYNRLLFENEVTHLVSIYRFSPNFYRVFFFFGWLSSMPSKMRKEKESVIFMFFEEWKNIVELQLDLIDTDYVFWKQNKYLLSSILGKAVHDISYIKTFKILRTLHPEYLGALVGIKNSNNNNKCNKCKGMTILSTGWLWR